MLHLGLSAAANLRGLSREAAGRPGPRRRRNRLTPDAESLEVRDCPSGSTAHLGVAESAHALRVAEHRAALLRAGEHRAAARRSHHTHPSRRVARQAGQTIYVAPRGKLGAAAGKNAAHPLGSLAVALKRAKPGTTIILAPGVYTQGAGIMGKSNITIIGAANQSSILAPSSGQALKVYASSNITIENVWFRAGGSGNIGLAVAGSSVTVRNIRTDGNSGTGVVVAAYGGQDGSLNASSSQFDSVQVGDGLDVQDGSVTIDACTFNNNGTAGGSAAGGSGLSVEGNSQATITNSQLVGNRNSNLVAFNQAQVTAQGSTFSSSRDGNGAIFSDQTTVKLVGNTFASNGTVVGYASGFNGIEFFSGFAGTALVSGNTFNDNTANGIFVGGSSQALQVVGNTFDDNLVGLNMDASVAPIAAVIQGNTFATTLGSGDQGLVAAGSGLTATIGGDGPAENTFENYAAQRSILQYHTSGSRTIGCPNLSIDTNTYLSGGRAVDPSQAILPCD